MDYNKLLEKARKIYSECVTGAEKRRLESIFPELKDSEDERIRKALLNEFILLQSKGYKFAGLEGEEIISWLEKQGDTNETIDKDKLAEGVLKGAAINLITWIDYNAAKGNMCLSNMECKDIEDALVSSNWDKIYAYIKKKLEKQGEQNPAWSEEDEKILNSLISSLARIGASTRTDSTSINYTFSKEIDWLKSLRPQNTWKPSDEQMHCFKCVIDFYKTKVNDTIVLNLLNSLYEQLVKL